MVICKYFLRGNCRFGENCKNEHVYNDNSSSILRKKTDIDINVLIKAVSNDMERAEHGNQWPLSCYGPFQGKPSFPGFEDKCFEEIRLGMYEAERNRTVEQYKQQLTLILQEARMKMRSLQNPTAEATNVLRELYSTNNDNNQSSNIFSNPQGGFGNTFQTNNTPVVQQQSIFGNTNNTHATQMGKSIFGTTTVTSNSPNNFTFALPATNKSIFGNVQSAQNQSSIFGQSGQSAFGGNNVFRNFTTNQPQQQQNFATNQPQQQQNFATNQPQQQQQNIFQQTSQQNMNPSTVSYSQSIFGNPAGNQTSVFKQSPFQNQPTNAFSANPFAQTQNQPSFGTLAAENKSNQSPFGATNTSNSPFGAVTSGQSPFGAPSLGENKSNQSPFGAPNLATSENNHHSPFGAPNLTTGDNKHQSPFGASNLATGENNHPSPFGAPSLGAEKSNQSPFGAPNLATGENNHPSPFGAPSLGTEKSNQSPFGAPSLGVTENKSIFSTQTSVFGNTANQNSVFQQNIFNTQNQVQPEQHKSIFTLAQQNIGFKTSESRKQDDISVYSKVEDLSEGDVKLFQAPVFEFGKIPEKAPTLQLCS